MAPEGDHANDDDSHLASARKMIEIDHARAGGDWWATPTAAVIVDLAKVWPFVVALAGIITVLREGLDPLWVVGPDPDGEPKPDRSRIGLPTLRPYMCMESPAAGFAVAQEWVDAGVDAGEVADWLRAGCWSAKAARSMVDAGLRPWRLLTDGEPVYMVDVGPDGPIPLAQAVADSYLTATDAVRHLVRNGARAEAGW